MQIAILSAAWFLGGTCPAAAQDEQEPTAKQAAAPVDDDSPEKPLHAYGTLSLEQAIAQALRTNPELLIADAKARQMKAELNQARLTVVRDVTVAYQNWAAAKQNLPFSEKMTKQGYRTSAEVLAAKQKLAASEYELMYLLGAGAESDSDDAEASDAAEPPGADRGARGHGSRTARQDGVRPEIPLRYREWMKKNVEFDVTDQPLSDALEYLKLATEEFSTFVFKGTEGPRDVPLTLKLRSVTLAAALEALADQTDVCFVFRDYGVLVVQRDDAWQYGGAAIPSDTPLRAKGGTGGGG
ncbi:MAG TPA: hypothetical protein VND64_17325, partial [Pirellulales bacterium]|nr:hypothetical protein [Pirellulales bacterium]